MILSKDIVGELQEDPKWDVLVMEHKTQIQLYPFEKVQDLSLFKQVALKHLQL
jgi:hypothetical protein